ncbi:hypothetical protein SAMN04489844_1461 [Nocardioides exalbidus]|uniref:Phage integrase family protein n=2 Tax=Nocardioides exalbidus TaxID=402596 RepID=A0A1H4NUU3_9ACTN|nr:hypothetical protein SAMN04489844_1461 [Nocardioides exalbidus]
MSRIRVRPQVVEAVMRVPYVSARTDGAMMGRTYMFAMWLDETQGSFDWRRDLTAENINAFAAANLVTHAQGTVNTYRSTLMRVKRGGQIVTPVGKRTEARRAYTSMEFEVIERTIDVAGSEGEDWKVHLALSGGAGLRPEEIPYAHASWVHEGPSGTFIRVPNKKGTYRDVPLLGRFAETIRNAARRNEGTYLFCPELRGRANALSYMKRKIRGMHPSIVDYDVTRARHYWISRMLDAAVPATLIAEIADIHAGAHLLADLLSEMPRPDLDESFAALAAAGLSD